MFATSEFPLEIPRMQTRNFTYTKPLGAIKKQHRKMGELSEIAKACFSSLLQTAIKASFLLFPLATNWT